MHLIWTYSGIPVLSLKQWRSCESGFGDIVRRYLYQNRNLGVTNHHKSVCWLLRWSQMNSMDTIWHQKHHKTSSDEIWIVNVCECQTCCLFYLSWEDDRCTIEHNEGLFVRLPTKDNIDIRMTTQGFYVLPLATQGTQKPSKTRGPSDAVKHSETPRYWQCWSCGLLANDRNAIWIPYEGRRWLNGHMMATKTAPKLPIVIDCHRLIANGVFIILKGGHYASLAQRGKRIEFPGQDTSIWSFLLHLQPDTSRDSAESPSHDFPDVVYLKIFETPSGLAILWRYPVLTLPHAQATKCLSSFVEAIEYFHYIGIYSCDILRLCKYIIPYIYIPYIHIYRYIPYIYIYHIIPFLHWISDLSRVGHGHDGHDGHDSTGQSMAFQVWLSHR